MEAPYLGLVLCVGVVSSENDTTRPRGDFQALRSSGLPGCESSHQGAGGTLVRDREVRGTEVRDLPTCGQSQEAVGGEGSGPGPTEGQVAGP